MLYKKILVPYDGSEPADDALKVAETIASDDPEATIYVVTAISAGTLAAELESTNFNKNTAPMIMGTGSSYEAIIDEAKTRASERLHTAVAPLVENAPCQVVIDVLISGKVATGIVDFAKQVNADLIVMGRHGRGGLRGMLGSVSYAVLHEADIPVLSVK